jgi:hypothetical protein
MTDKEALRTFSQGQELDQITVRRLMRSGLIDADNITTIDSDGEVYKPVAITKKGQKLLEDC